MHSTKAVNQTDLLENIISECTWSFNVSPLGWSFMTSLKEASCDAIGLRVAVAFAVSSGNLVEGLFVIALLKSLIFSLSELVPTGFVKLRRFFGAKVFWATAVLDRTKRNGKHLLIVIGSRLVIWFWSLLNLGISYIWTN